MFKILSQKRLFKRGFIPHLFLRNAKKGEGFTLVEIMVAVSIITLMTSLALAGYESVKVSTRNAQRLADVKRIELSLELYLADNGHYPKQVATLKDSQCTPEQIADENSEWTALVSDLSPYMKLTGDPLCNKGSDAYNYYYVANANDGYRTYGFMMKFEDPCTGIDAENDGGSQNTSKCIWYEFGSQPKFCKDQNKEWFYPGDNVCN
ncbi:hypothetical protein COB55_00075 [Candidatus Wolfebacteria bacterium]|nr:MAG: hypothetical protein COB55_00075 [Candidatus Wolfebacteria bacterium]